jgi:adenylosuccinate lyase
MQYLFSPQKKFSTWRRLWLSLAKAEQELGLEITDGQLAEMQAHLDDIDFTRAAEHERRLRHDVMAHIHTFAEAAPAAARIIHLGATSCYVGDNTDIIIMREGLQLIRERLCAVIAALCGFAEEYKALPTLGFTHFQPAQPVTVGKRASLWINELLLDLDELNFRIGSLKMLGCKGTTGTQASFVELFSGDSEKIKALDSKIAADFGFDESVPVSGQTYSRKTDFFVLATLSGIAQSCAKFGGDLRLLSHLKEIEEPFEEKQVGSSAMPYKRNPMRSERICSLARYVISAADNPAQTAANQWFERTLDDSANKRIAVPESFLAVDAILSIYLNVASGLKVYPKIIEKHLADELPFMASENILMKAVSKGGDRQKLHEKIRLHSLESGRVVKVEGKPNDLIARIVADSEFGLTEREILAELDPSKFTGRAAEQTTELVAIAREKIAGYLSDSAPAELKV